ncbi:MAG: PAS domain-containing protein, partial [Janthinobacterium lividum]
MLASSDRDEAQIRRFISAIDVAAYVTDSDGSLVAYNEAAERLWGAKPQDGARCFIGVGEITTPDGARLSYDQSSAAQCARSDRPVRGQKLLLGGLDARPVAVEAASLPLRCSPDHGSYVVTTITRVVPEAFATFAHYRAALEHSPLVPWIADAAGLLIRAEVSGFASQENARGLGRSWIDFVDPVDRAVVSDAWQVSIGSGTSLDVEFRVWQSGVVQWCRGRAVARRDEHDDIIAWYGSIENIHDRKVAIIALKDSEQRALSILQNSPASMRMLELDGTTIFLNEMSKDVARTFAYDANLGARWQDDLPAAYWAEGSLAIERAAAGHRSTMTIRATVDGTFRWWNVTVAPVLGVDGLPVEILTIAHDITEQTNAMAALELAKAEAEIVAGKLMTVLESTTDNVVVIDRDYRVAYVNDNAARLIGGSRCQPGISVFEMFGEGGGAFVDHLQEACDKGTAVTFESCMSGLGLRLEVRVFPSDTGSSIFFRDVSDRHRADEERRAVEERMSQMALRDALTGLANRTLFQQALEAALHGGDRL